LASGQIREQMDEPFPQSNANEMYKKLKLALLVQFGQACGRSSPNAWSTQKKQTFIAVSV